MWKRSSRNFDCDTAKPKGAATVEKFLTTSAPHLDSTEWHFTVGYKHSEFRPLIQCVVNRFAQETLW